MTLPRTVGIVGIGLVGGSLVRSLRAASWRPLIVAVDSSEHVRERLTVESLADRIVASPDEADLGECDLVVLAAPIAAILASLAPVSARMRDGSVLTDVAGVKRVVLDRARLDVRRGVSFVGAHPMFGGERGGFDAASADRWSGGVVAVCDDGDAEAVACVAELHRALGAEVVACSADAHDAAVAAVSHLPYVVASALSLVGRDGGALARRLAGQGFSDSTRLARFAYDVQGAVAARNPHLREAALRLRDALDRLVGSLDDEKAARVAFDAARAAREELE